jgi:hypothetical protein
MNMKLNLPSVNQQNCRTTQGYALLRRGLPLVKFRVVFILIALGLMLTGSGSALGQKSRTNRSKASSQKPQSGISEAVTVTAKRMTMRPGYDVVSQTGNTVVVARPKGGGVTIQATCGCVIPTPEGGSECTVSNDGPIINCVPGLKGCKECKWRNVKRRPKVGAIQ